MGTSEMGTYRMGTSEMGTSEMGTSDTGTSEMGTSETGTSEMDTSEMGTSEMQTSEMGHLRWSYLREFVLNSRHPDPRRAWKGGAKPQVVDEIVGIRRMRG